MVNQLPFKITHVKSACNWNNFVILKDECNRFWCCGSFGEKVTSHFQLLDRGDLLTDLKKKGNKITHFEVIGSSCLVCLNDRYLYGIGDNSSGQLGLGTNENSTAQKKFVKVKWNLNGKFQVKEIKSGTFILTSKLIFTNFYFKLLKINGYKKKNATEYSCPYLKKEMEKTVHFTV